MTGNEAPPPSPSSSLFLDIDRRRRCCCCVRTRPYIQDTTFADYPQNSKKKYYNNFMSVCGKLKKWLEKASKNGDFHSHLSESGHCMDK